MVIWMQSESLYSIGSFWQYAEEDFLEDLIQKSGAKAKMVTISKHLQQWTIGRFQALW